MKANWIIAGIISSAALLPGCASVQSVSLTSIPAKKGSEVRAEASRLIILGLNFNNDFIDDMADDLKSQCKGGQIRGILTKDEAINYFLFLVYSRRVTATGYCLMSKGDVAFGQQEGQKP